MQSKNKKTPTQAEKAHILRIKEMNCILCNQTGPSECHEIKQGQWFTSLPLCSDCHRGAINGIHGQKRIWSVKKMDELSALNETIKKLMNEGGSQEIDFWNFKKVSVQKNLVKSVFKIGYAKNPKNQLFWSKLSVNLRNILKIISISRSIHRLRQHTRMHSTGHRGHRHSMSGSGMQHRQKPTDNMKWTRAGTRPAGQQRQAQHHTAWDQAGAGNPAQLTEISCNWSPERKMPDQRLAGFMCFCRSDRIWSHACDLCVFLWCCRQSLHLSGHSIRQKNRNPLLNMLFCLCCRNNARSDQQSPDPAKPWFLLQPIHALGLWNNWFSA